MENDTTALLQLMLTDGLGTQTLRRLLIRLAAEGLSPADVISFSPTEIARQFSVKPEVALAISAKYDGAAALYTELEQHEIQVLALEQPGYPSRLRLVLGETSPPIIYAYGNLDLLESQSVGFCGSRKASELGILSTRGYARALSELGMNIVSGYAHGVDLAAHAGAFESGGTTVLVLAEGILRFRLKADLRAFVTEQNWAVVSEFPPHLGWIARNAMQRNRTICGLSDAVILVEPGMTGGTFAAGETAMELQRKLFVVVSPDSDSKGEASDYFLARGASALTSDGFDSTTVVDAIHAPQTSQDDHKQQIRQRGLFD